MKRVIYKKTGEVNKDTKSFPAILFRSRERNRNLLIGNSPVEVSNNEYEALKKSKHGKDIVMFTKNTKLPKPIEVVKGENKKKKVIFTKNYLFSLNKKEQIEMLKELKAEKIPRLEKNKVDLILKLQGGK